MSHPERRAVSEPAVGGRLTAHQIKRWRTQGFALVHDLLPDSLLQETQADATAAFPDPNDPAAANITDFGSGQSFVFPSRSRAANALTLHPSLLQAVADLLAVPIGETRLTQSDIWIKYGRETTNDPYDNADQRIHCDYPNHTLTHPPAWATPDAVEMIIYLGCEADCGGATAVVPRAGDNDPAYPWPITLTPGIGDVPYINNRARAEAYLREHAPAAAEFRQTHLYAREHYTAYRFGSILFYRHDTWHRGTPVRPGGARVVANLTFKRATSDWINVLHPGWSWSMYQPDQPVEHLIAQASVEQRAVLGFPLPGSSYWTSDTIAAVAQRYAAQGIDMTPYRDALE